MNKYLNIRYLRWRHTTRVLLAVSLSTTLAATGCTTNRTLGNGAPVRDGSVRTAPTGGVSGGSEIPVPPPMTSPVDASPRARGQGDPYVGPEVAATMMARQQRVRVLGPANPGLEPRPARRPVVDPFQVGARVRAMEAAGNAAISGQGTATGEIIGAVTADGNGGRSNR
jgi:hypothetical protein